MGHRRYSARYPSIQAATYTDNSAAGTRATGVSVSINRPTFAASNASTIITDAATFYIANSPAAGANMTLTNAYALWVDNGTVRLDGTLFMNDANVQLGTTTGTKIGTATPLRSSHFSIRHP
jgi:hypothetical protein